MDERERFEKWARDSGISLYLAYSHDSIGYQDRDTWKSFATWQAAIQAERERCAKIALLEKVDAESTGTEADRAYNYACEHIADVIRRGEGA